MTEVRKFLVTLLNAAKKNLRHKNSVHYCGLHRVPESSAERNTSVKIEKIIFKNKRVELVVKMPDPNHCTTRDVPHLPKRLFGLFPHLAEHRCENDGGYTFRQESRCTEIPHLLEHLIIELQGQAHPHGILRGETKWNWHEDPKGLFHVTIDYENELLVLGAIRTAERIINALDAHEDEAIDNKEEIKYLRKIAELGKQDPSAERSKGLVRVA